jgi:hypothetical protein
LCFCLETMIFLCSWEHRCISLSHSAYWLRWGLENSLPELACNHDPPHLYCQRNWNYNIRYWVRLFWHLLS